MTDEQRQKRLDDLAASYRQLLRRNLQPGRPCSPGCLEHLTEPCDGCGRIGGHEVIDTGGTGGKIEFEDYESPEAVAYRARIAELESLKAKIAPLTPEQIERRAVVNSDAFWKDSMLYPDTSQIPMPKLPNVYQHVPPPCLDKPAEVVNSLPGGWKPAMVARGESIARTLENVYPIKEHGGYYDELSQENERRGITIRRLSLALFGASIAVILLSLAFLLRQH